MSEQDDLRTFTRDLLTRFERQQDAAITELVAQRTTWQAALERQLKIWRDEMRLHREELRDLRDESRAQRQALLRMLDRLDGPNPGASAA